jgi:hypothetical protein
MNPGSPWTMYRTRFLVRARRLTEPLVFIDALGREQSGRAGDYLVEFAEGVRRITARIIFEDIYIPLGAALPGNLPGTLTGKEGGPGGLRQAVPHVSREHRSAEQGSANMA